MKYYCLTFRTTCGSYSVGSKIFNAENALFIGQQESADIRITCSATMLPQSFAVILPNSSNVSWRLVRQTDFYDVKVNGTIVDYACVLADGDEIELVCDTPLKLRFSLHDDAGYEAAHGIDYRKKSTYGYIAIAAIFLASLVAGVLAFTHNSDKFSPSDMTDMKQSVYMIRVTNILLQMHSSDMAAGTYETVEVKEPTTASHGTCFYTIDSLCVTARHCIEPWLTYNWSELQDTTDIPLEVKWSLRAETSVLNQQDTIYRVVSSCEICDADSVIATCSSNDFNFNRSRDEIVRLWDEGYVWRNIYPLFNRKDVELGDFAFMKTDRAGNLNLAVINYKDPWAYNSVEKKIIGYPKTNQVERSMVEVDNIYMPLLDKDNNPTTDIKLKVDATEGYSGSPIVIKKNGELRVIGVLSKSDDYDRSNTFYAVPASEITNYDKERANEQIRYRR